MMLDNIVFLDLETTGLHPENDEIIEIGAVKIKEGVQTEYRQLVNPVRDHISPVILNLCEDLTEEKLRQSPDFTEIENDFLSFVEDLPIACHNVQFDQPFLARALGDKLRNTFLDTLELFCLLKPGFPKHGIGYIAEHYLGKEPDKKHRALEDARITLEATQKLFNDLWDEDNELLQRTVENLNGMPHWPWLDYLNTVPYKLTAETVKSAKTQASRIRKKITKSVYTTKDTSKILSEETLWEKHFPGYRYKKHQMVLAENIIKTFEREETLFTEAPTGSGKTLAYLLVALLWAVEKQEKIFITTNTKNLQQQIDRDLPRLCRVLGIENLKHIEMKGINNYACKLKIEKEFGETSADLDDRMARIYLYNWMKRTKTGEIEDISYWFRQQNKRINILINQISCNKEECSDTQCDYVETCFYKNKVSELYESSICTINHSLLLTWPQSYPPIRKLIIDEAHSLEDNCFDGFSEEVSSGELKGLLYRLYRSRTDGYLHYLLYRYKQSSPGADFGKAFSLVSELKDAVEQISSELGNISMGNLSGYSFREEISPEWAELKTLVTGCSNLLEKLASFLEDTIKDASFMDDTFEDTAICRQGAAYYKTLRGWSKTLSCCINDEDEKNCRYVEYRRGRWFFRVTPLDVSEQFYIKVLQNIESVILTSATLSEKGGYDRLVENLGFERLEEGRIKQLEPLEHLFDYKNNSVLAIPTDPIHYLDSAFVDYMSEAILKATSLIGGRTLVLFTNLQRMEQVVDRVKIPLEKRGISPYYAEGTSRQGLIDMFKEDRNSVLFGSRAFFEGIDIKGAGLSCIIIDKLPYPYPGEPLYNARTRYLTDKQKNAFKELSLSLVIRTFRQQFGRLIRSENDRGFVLVLSQLDKDRNRKKIISELPPTRVIKEPLQSIIDTMHQQFTDWGYKTYDTCDKRK